MDQDYRLLNCMAAVSNVYSIIVKTQGLTGASIHSLSRPERKLIAFLRKAKVM